MKNLKISVKLLLGFAVVILLAMIIAGVGLYSMQQMDSADQHMYSDNINSIRLISNIRNNVLLQRIYLRDLVMHSIDTDAYSTAGSRLSELEVQMDELLDLYGQTEFIDDELDTYLQFCAIYDDNYALAKNKIKLQTETNNSLTSTYNLDKARPDADKMAELLEECFQYNMRSAHNRVMSNSQLFASSSMTVLITLALSILIAILVALYLNKLISVPIRRIVRSADEIADGNVDVEIPQYGKDELGELAQAFNRMVHSIKVQSDFLAGIADSDFSKEFKMRSDRDALGKSLIDMTSSLNRIVYEFASMSDEVANGASQVSTASQSLAQGSSEQATAIEQLSSSIFEISLNTKDNAKMAQKASELYQTVRNRAQEGNTKMDDMSRAVHDIDESSKSISRIIRTINDIAFQTNILSLNAAVEAANAGQHGKGFAVVASEVRQLAGRSAQAAKDTQQLIEDSLAKTRVGSKLTLETQQAFGEIVDSIIESSQLLSDIAQSSSEQAIGIEQVNIGIEQVAQVVNLVSTNAEKSAIAAEQMFQRAASMRGTVKRIKLADEYDKLILHKAPEPAPLKRANIAMHPQISLDLDTNQQKY